MRLSGSAVCPYLNNFSPRVSGSLSVVAHAWFLSLISSLPRPRHSLVASDEIWDLGLRRNTTLFCRPELLTSSETRNLSTLINVQVHSAGDLHRSYVDCGQLRQQNHIRCYLKICGRCVDCTSTLEKSRRGMDCSRLIDYH